jgi:flagellar motor component MotA
MSTPQEEQKDFDILEMPAEGLAAYWLSIKKLIDVKRSKKILEEEIRYTREPFIKHMLETAFSGLDEESVRRLALAKEQTITIDYERKLAAMSIAVLAVSSKENPRVSFVRMASHFPFSPITEKKAFSLAHGISDGLKSQDSNQEVLLEIDHKLQNDRLLVKLLFHVITARREGKQTLEKFLPYIKTPYYLNGLTQAIDGFEHRVLKLNMEAQTKEILLETKRKMEMAAEMCIGIRNKLSYEDIFKIAKAYMP